MKQLRSDVRLVLLDFERAMQRSRHQEGPGYYAYRLGIVERRAAIEDAATKIVELACEAQLP